MAKPLSPNDDSTAFESNTSPNIGLSDPAGSARTRTRRFLSPLPPLVSSSLPQSTDYRKHRPLSLRGRSRGEGAMHVLLSTPALAYSISPPTRQAQSSISTAPRPAGLPASTKISLAQQTNSRPRSLARLTRSPDNSKPCKGIPQSSRQATAHEPTASSRFPEALLDLAIREQTAEPASPSAYDRSGNTMQLPSMPSISRVRQRCSAAFSLKEGSSTNTSSVSAVASCSKPDDPCYLGSTTGRPTPSTRRFPNASLTRSQSVGSPPRMSNSTSNWSFSSLRMLLFKRQKSKPVTYKNLQISGPIELGQQTERQMAKASNLGNDTNVGIDKWRAYGYENMRPATPPMSVRHQPPALLRSNIPAPPVKISTARTRNDTEFNASGLKKWSLFRSKSIQRQPSAGVVNTVNPSTSHKTHRMEFSRQSIQPKHMHNSSTSSEVPLISRQQPDIPVRNEESWRGMLALKSRSSLNVKQAIRGRPKRQAPPPRPPRPQDIVELFDETWPDSPSLKQPDSLEGSSRIDPYGWQNIKPLPGRGRLTPDASDVPHPSGSTSSGSSYSLTSELRHSSHSDSSHIKERTEKHRRAAYGALAGEKERSQMRLPPLSGSNKPPGTRSHTRGKQNQEPRPSPSSTSAKRYVEAGKYSWLTAVEEEQGESSHDDPLPPTSRIRVTQPKKAVRQKSQIIFVQGDYKPWWEEQNIKDNDLCFELDPEPMDGMELRVADKSCWPLQAERDVQDGKGSAAGLDLHASSHSPLWRTQDRAERCSIESNQLPDIKTVDADKPEAMGLRECKDMPQDQTRVGRFGGQIVNNIAASSESKKSGKWRFSVFEKTFDGTDGGRQLNPTDVESKGPKKPGMAQFDPCNESACASSATLSDSEKVKLTPPPLRVPSTKETPTSSEAKAAIQASNSATVQESEQQPFLLQNNEPESDSSSSRCWSDTKQESQTDTPATSRNSDHNQPIDDKYGNESENDIIDSYLSSYNADLAPPLPVRNPKRISNHISDQGLVAGRETVDVFKAEDVSHENVCIDEDEAERRRWEDVERHRRVSEILGRLRATSGVSL